MASSGMRQHHTIRIRNGVVERCFRTLFERTRAILSDSGMPSNKWGEAISYVTYLKNRSPRHVDKTPFELMYGRQPDLSGARIFGCVAYSYNIDPQKKKLDDRSINADFLAFKATTSIAFGTSPPRNSAFRHTCYGTRPHPFRLKNRGMATTTTMASYNSSTEMVTTRWIHQG